MNTGNGDLCSTLSVPDCDKLVGVVIDGGLGGLGGFVSSWFDEVPSLTSVAGVVTFFGGDGARRF
jgi:hypothetical protein